MGSWAAVCVCVCVWIWVGYDCWLELVSSTVGCLEWQVILVWVAKWSRFCQLIKFGRKCKNAWKTWVMSFPPPFLSLPSPSLFQRLLHFLIGCGPHVYLLWGEGRYFGQPHLCTLPSVAFLTLTVCMYAAFSWAGLVSIFNPLLRAVSAISQIGFFHSSWYYRQRLLGKSMEEIPRQQLLLERIRFNSKAFYWVLLSKVC